MASFASNKINTDRCCNTGGSSAPVDEAALRLTSSQITDLNPVVQALIDSSISSGVIWNIVQNTTVMLPGNGYICNSLSQLTLVLPSTASLGARLFIYGLGTGGWRIEQPAATQIQIGNIATTYGVQGQVLSTQVGDFLPLVYAAGMWLEIGMRGILNVL